ncbi:MAG: hypothetical protein IT453_14605 [Planctomycetes bacterium]|nr:hypothetical protein [Planctomycetota bacterium]
MVGASPRANLVERFDRLTLLGMAVGVAILLQPWWQAGFRIGFFVTLGATLLQIVAAHLPSRARAEDA